MSLVLQLLLDVLLKVIFICANLLDAETKFFGTDVQIVDLPLELKEVFREHIDFLLELLSLSFDAGHSLFRLVDGRSERH